MRVGRCVHTSNGFFAFFPLGSRITHLGGENIENLLLSDFTIELFRISRMHRLIIHALFRIRVFFYFFLATAGGVATLIQRVHRVVKS